MANLNRYLSSSKNQLRNEERAAKRKTESKLLQDNVISNFWQVEEDPESMLAHHLSTGDVVNSYRSLLAIKDPELRLGVVIDIIDKQNVAALETFLRLGYAFENPTDLETLVNAISNSENKDIVFLASRYKIYQPVVDDDSFVLNRILRSASEQVFSPQIKYAYRAVRDRDAKIVRFAVGQLQTDSNFFEEYLPTLFGMIPWTQRFDELDVRELFALADDPSKEQEMIITLSRRDTTHQKSALRYLSESDVDNKLHSWNIAEVWSVEIMTVAEFLKVLGRCKLLGIDPFIAFNYLNDSVFDSNFAIISGEGGVETNVRLVSQKATEIRQRWNF